MSTQNKIYFSSLVIFSYRVRDIVWMHLYRWLYDYIKNNEECTFLAKKIFSKFKILSTNNTPWIVKPTMDHIHLCTFRESQENIDFDFSKTQIAAKLIIVSEHIREIFNELDSSSEVVEFRVCPHTSTIKISTFGIIHYNAEIPANSDMVNHFQVVLK